MEEKEWLRTYYKYLFTDRWPRLLKRQWKLHGGDADALRAYAREHSLEPGAAKRQLIAEGLRIAMRRSRVEQDFHLLPPWSFEPRKGRMKLRNVRPDRDWACDPPLRTDEGVAPPPPVVLDEPTSPSLGHYAFMKWLAQTALAEARRLLLEAYGPMDPSADDVLAHPTQSTTADGETDIFDVLKAPELLSASSSEAAEDGVRVIGDLLKEWRPDNLLASASEQQLEIIVAGFPPNVAARLEEFWQNDLTERQEEFVLLSCSTLAEIARETGVFGSLGDPGRNVRQQMYRLRKKLAEADRLGPAKS